MTFAQIVSIMIMLDRLMGCFQRCLGGLQLTNFILGTNLCLMQRQAPLLGSGFAELSGLARNLQPRNKSSFLGTNLSKPPGGSWLSISCTIAKPQALFMNGACERCP